MKKIFLLILCTAMLLCSCNINPTPPQATDNTDEDLAGETQFTSPEDEEEERVSPRLRKYARRRDK